MKRWVRAHRNFPCGSCRSVIAEGSPLLEITIIAPQSETKRARCVSCAKSLFGDDPPVELPALPEQTHTRAPEFASTRSLAAKFRDGKAQQLGRERD